MGREVRRVPPRWEHPKTETRYGKETFQPMYEQEHRHAAEEWMDEMILWRAGKHKEQVNEKPDDKFPWREHCPYYWDWGSGPPKDSDYYAPDGYNDTPDEERWYQYCETVSEGTPLSPPFKTKMELIKWLVSNEDYWEQGPMTDAQAKGMVGTGWAPSFVISSDTGVTSGVEIVGKDYEEKNG